jgi:hypothetical protein
MTGDRDHFRAPDELTPISPSPYGTPESASRGFRLSVTNFWKLREIETYVKDRADNSGLRGQVNGPRYAYRHALLAGELVRNFGKEDALAILDHHESKNRRSRSRFVREDTAMDDFVNLRAVTQMIGVTSREDAERRADEIIRAAKREGGSGTNATVPYYPRRMWMTRGIADDSDIPQVWGAEPPGAQGTTRNSLLVDGILGKPAEDWSEAERRLVVGDRRYWDTKRRDPSIIARVVESYGAAYDRNGPVEVDAYTRADGTQVAAHDRSAPRR